MEIKQNLDASTPRPGDRLVQDGQLPLNVGVAVQRRNSPIANWYTDVVQSSFRDLIEVILGNPAIPVVLQIFLRLALAQGLRIGVLVHHFMAQGKDGGGDPWFKNEPAAQIHSTYFIVVVKGNVPLPKVAVEIVNIMFRSPIKAEMIMLGDWVLTMSE